MQLPILMTILYLWTINAKSIINQNKCTDVITINNKYYVKREIRNISGIPADMAVQFKTGNVFFTMVNLLTDQIKMSVQLMRPTGDIRPVKLTGLGQSTAIDNTNDIVYFATDNGVYKLGDPNPYTAIGEDVMYIAVARDAIYIATFPQNRVHKITNDGKNQVMFLSITDGHGITVDNENNIYFLASKTAYVLQNGHDISIKITGLSQDGVTGFFVSKHGEVYTIDERSNLYKIDGETATANRLGSFGVNEVNTFGMDKDDNVIIGMSKAIVDFEAFDNDPCEIRL